jgi:hypothetical protein
VLASAGDVASRNALALECLVDLPNQEIFSILMITGVARNMHIPSFLQKPKELADDERFGEFRECWNN